MYKYPINSHGRFLSTEGVHSTKAAAIKNNEPEQLYCPTSKISPNSTASTLNKAFGGQLILTLTMQPGFVVW